MKSTERFSDRVTNYVRYRPSYPQALVDLLVHKVGQTHIKRCADIGAGTGILTKLLCPHFATVIAVEPNREMRLASEADLQRYPNVLSSAGTAEATQIEATSIDLITVAQAFHWFDQTSFRLECQRILRPEAIVALIWNRRNNDTPFLERYEELLRRYATDYNEVNHHNVTHDQLTQFFGGSYAKEEFSNQQQFDLVGLFGRTDSSSYAPKPGTANFQILRGELAKAFASYSVDGAIAFTYTTELYWGRIS